MILMKMGWIFRWKLELNTDSDFVLGDSFFGGGGGSVRIFWVQKSTQWGRPRCMEVGKPFPSNMGQLFSPKKTEVN